MNVFFSFPCAFPQPLSPTQHLFSGRPDNDRRRRPRLRGERRSRGGQRRRSARRQRSGRHSPRPEVVPHRNPSPGVLSCSRHGLVLGARATRGSGPREATKAKTAAEAEEAGGGGHKRWSRSRSGRWRRSSSSSSNRTSAGGRRGG